MNTASKKGELPKRGKKPSTHRRIVTANVNGKAVVQSDEPLLAYGVQDCSRLRTQVIPDLSTEPEFRN